MVNLKELLQSCLEEKKGEYLDFLKKLVKIDTRVIGHGINGGNEQQGQLFLEKKIRELGGDARFFEVKEDEIQQAIRKYGEGNPGHNYKERANLVGFFKGSGGGRSLILNGHVDTMPFGERKLWKYDPFLGEEINGRVYGLGSTDMKGGLCASLLALDLLKSAGIRLKGKVIFQSVVDEEGGGNGTLSLVQKGIKADGAVICEPTNNHIEIAHMGFMFYKIRVHGKALHSSRKWVGINAIEKAIKIIQELKELEHEWLMKYKHPLLPPPTLNIGVIKGGDAGSTVPAECEFKLCLHYFPGIDKKTIMNDIQNVLDDVIRGDRWLRENPPETKIYQEGGAFQIPESHQLVQIFLDSMPHKRKLRGSPAGNDARLLKNIAGIPTIVFGPGNPEHAHSIDESLAIEEYFESILTYAIFITNWCGWV